MACFRTVRRISEHVEYPYRMLFSVWLASYTVCLERSTCRSCTGFDCWKTGVIYRWLCSTCGTDVVLVGHLLSCWARCFWSAYKCVIAISYLCSATGLVMFNLHICKFICCGHGLGCVQLLGTAHKSSGLYFKGLTVCLKELQPSDML